MTVWPEVGDEGKRKYHELWHSDSLPSLNSMNYKGMRSWWSQQEQEHKVSVLQWPAVFKVLYWIQDKTTAITDTGGVEIYATRNFVLNPKLEINHFTLNEFCETKWSRF